mgnify:CR=1 FL=1
MSIKVMSWVWECSQQQGGALLVLLAIADFADDSGVAYPAIATLAAKARLSEASIHQIIRELIAAGELTVERQAGPHQANIFQVTGEGCQNNTPRGVKITPSQNNTGVAHDTPGVSFQPQGVSPATQRGVVGDTQTVINRQLEPSSEPSAERASSANAPEALAAQNDFASGFQALRTIPAYRPVPDRDRSLTAWLTEHQVGSAVFFRAATALAARWPPRGSKNPDPWLQVRTYALNQKRWDVERTANNSAPARAGYGRPAIYTNANFPESFDG